MDAFQITINGPVIRSMPTAICSLLWVLRDVLGMTGTAWLRHGAVRLARCISTTPRRPHHDDRQHRRS